MNKKGIALIMVVGVLALLAIIATSFALNMRLEYHAATNYYNSVKARYFAEAALERAIAELRAYAKSNAFNDLTQPWASTGYQNTSINLNINGSGTSLTTNVYDEQRKINVNNANSTLLNNLFTQLSLSNPSGVTTRIITNKPANGYKSFTELKTIAQLTKSEFDVIKTSNSVTVNSYGDVNMTPSTRSPVNINTCSAAVLKSVIVNIDDGVGNVISSGEADAVITCINAARPLDSWSDFDSAIQLAVTNGSISPSEGDVIKNNCNPNRDKPAVVYTTEFCFNSGGYYNVIAHGTTTDFLNVTQADRTLSAIVKIYDIYCETKVKDGSGNPTQFALGKPERVTWLDSCPVRSDQVFGVYQIPSSAEKIKGSVKLGFWDDFNANADGGDRDYSKKHWKKNLSVFASDSDFSNGELVTLGGVRFDLYGPDDGVGWAYWPWGDFAMRVHANEYSSSATLMKHAAWIFFRKADGGIPYSGHPGVFHSSGGQLSWEDSSHFAYANLWSSPINEVFLTPDEAYQRKDQYGAFVDAAAAGAGKHSYPAQIRIVTAYKEGSIPAPNPIPSSGWPCEENGDTSSSNLYQNYKTDLAASNEKTFILSARSNNIALDVWTGASSHAILNRTLNTEYDVINRDGTSTKVKSSTSGRTVLYGWDVNVKWDDIRIISPDGKFTSQTINSTLSPHLSGKIEWGTITGTVTIPSTASSSSEGVTLQTKSNSDADWVVLSGSHIASAASTTGNNSIQYQALLASTNTTMQETPVFEDVTITYLPKVSVKSYSLSN